MVLHLLTCLLILAVLSTQLYAQFTVKMASPQVNIKETETQETRLVEVICSGSPVCICRLSSRGSSPFSVWNKGNGIDYYVYYVGEAQGGRLSFRNTPTYLLNITCHNLTLHEDFDLLQVDIIPNLPPVFTTHTANVTVTVPAQDGDLVYGAKAMDPENQAVEYSITATNPAVNYFIVDRVSGTVSISTQTQLYTATESHVVVTVTATDDFGGTDTLTLNVVIRDVNQRPDILELPATIHKPEDIAVGSNLITLTVDDKAAPYPTTPPTFTVIPNNERYKFDLKQTGASTYHLVLLSPLDYETTNNYFLVFEVSDGYLTSPQKGLKLNVDNVNEPPVFADVAYYCDLEESNAGLSTCYLGLHDIVTDPEGDVITSVAFLPGNNSQRFRYTRSTTGVTFNVDYDVDNGMMPTSVVLQLQASDFHGATSRVPVYLQIRDANDNTCYFPGGVVQTRNVDQNTPLGTLVRIVARDDDLTTPNNDVTYETVSGSPPDFTNYISAFSDGTVAYTGQIPDSGIQKIYSLVVRCRDGGVPRRSSEATFVLNYTPTTTTIPSTTTTASTTSTTTTLPTTTTTRKPSIWKDASFVGVFAALMCLTAFGLIAGLYLCARYCCSLGSVPLWQTEGLKEFFCPKRKPKKVKPVNDRVNKTTRTNPDYKDEYWHRGDKYESGRVQEPQSSRSEAPYFIKSSPPEDFTL